MLAQVEQNLGAKPEAASADTGYWSEAQVNDERLKGIELYVATGKQKHSEADGERPPGAKLPGTSPREKMKQKLASEAGRDINGVPAWLAAGIFRFFFGLSAGAMHPKDWDNFNPRAFAPARVISAQN